MSNQKRFANADTWITFEILLRGDPWRTKKSRKIAAVSNMIPITSDRKKFA
jgi:hypothetical protein